MFCISKQKRHQEIFVAGVRRWHIRVRMCVHVHTLVQDVCNITLTRLSTHLSI